MWSCELRKVLLSDQISKSLVDDISRFIHCLHHYLQIEMIISIHQSSPLITAAAKLNNKIETARIRKTTWAPVSAADWTTSRSWSEESGPVDSAPTLEKCFWYRTACVVGVQDNDFLLNVDFKYPEGTAFKLFNGWIGKGRWEILERLRNEEDVANTEQHRTIFLKRGFFFK